MKVLQVIAIEISLESRLWRERGGEAASVVATTILWIANIANIIHIDLKKTGAEGFQCLLVLELSQVLQVLHSV